MYVIYQVQNDLALEVWLSIEYNVASTYKIPNHPQALSHTVCGDH